MSNCIHSGLNRIFVLTQFNSVSLHRHIYNTYKFDPYGGGFVEILAAQQTMEHESWYQGTADAVRRNIPYFTESTYDLVLILSGDQLYRMDFQDMIRTHLENKAAVTIAALPVAEQEATSCGIMRIQADGRVVDFEEKPKTPEKLDRVRTDPSWLEKLGLKAAGRPYLASMGIYLFNRSLLVDLLRSSTATDFGHELLPQTIARPPRPGPPVRRLLGGHRDGRRLPQGQHRADARRPAVRLRLGGRADLHAAAVPALLADPRRDRQEQPDLRRLGHRPRLGHRELGDRRPGPHRRERHDPRHLHHGDRLPRAPPAAWPRTRGSTGHRSGSGPTPSSSARSSTRMPASAATSGSSTRPGSRTPRRPPTHVIRDGVVVTPRSSSCPTGP